MSYAKKVGSDFTRLDGSPEVEAYVSTKLPGQHNIRTIKRWSEDFRNSIDLYTIQSASLGEFERKTDALAFSDGVVSEGKEDMPLSVAKEVLRERVAAKRWAVETGGFSFTPTGGDPVTILTDRDSQSKFAGLFNLAGLAASDFTVAWKHSSGFLSLSKADAMRMTVEAGQHIQAAFAREATLSATINAASDLDGLADIDIEAGWS